MINMCDMFTMLGSVIFLLQCYKVSRKRGTGIFKTCIRHATTKILTERVSILCNDVIVQTLLLSSSSCHLLLLLIDKKKRVRYDNRNKHAKKNFRNIYLIFKR